LSEIERDSRIDAAWRAASRDEPPAHLDDAIRAAARRAVESGPRRKRDKHWWYPFAAAATVAVIAVGLLQLTPPEQVTPTIVSEVSKAAKQSAASGPVASSAPATPGSSGGAPESSSAQPDSSSQASNAFAPKGPIVVAKKETAVDERARLSGAMQNEQKPQRQPGGAEKPARVPEQDSARSIVVPASPPAEPARRSEPFPAAKPETAARRDAAVGGQTQSRERAEEAEPAAPPRAAAASAAAPGAAGGALLEQKRAEPQSTLAKDALQAVQAAPRAKTTAPRTVEDWIKLIRQLKGEGRIEEAKKEIDAFRSAYGERADSLLPADLRALTPVAPPSAK
jgi:hypothetical protein